jgi:CMP-N,N'-diacetyllegionaminic acid synthase
MQKFVDLLIIIPARKGSKGILNKNIRLLKKHPLISYSIEAAKRIKEKNKIIHISTDSKKILEISKIYYNSNNKLRPKTISKDSSIDLDFLNYTLKLYYKKKIFFKNCLILRPTNPIRKIKTLNKVYKKFLNSNFNSLKSIYKCEKTPFKMWTVDKKQELKNVCKLNNYEFFNYPRQILPLTFYQTGAIEIIKINFKKKLKKFSGKKIMGIALSKEESIDIDKYRDLVKAEKILKSNKSYIFPKTL